MMSTLTSRCIAKTLHDDFFDVLRWLRQRKVSLHPGTTINGLNYTINYSLLVPGSKVGMVFQKDTFD